MTVVLRDSRVGHCSNGPLAVVCYVPVSLTHHAALSVADDMPAAILAAREATMAPMPTLVAVPGKEVGEYSRPTTLYTPADRVVK